MTTTTVNVTPVATTPSVSDKRRELRNTIANRYLGTIRDEKTWAIETGRLLAEYIDLGLAICSDPDRARETRAADLQSITDQLREEFGAVATLAPQQAVAVYWTHHLAEPIAPSVNSQRVSLRAIRVLSPWIKRHTREIANANNIVTGHWEEWSIRDGYESALKTIIDDQAATPVNEDGLRHAMKTVELDRAVLDAGDDTRKLATATAARDAYAIEHAASTASKGKAKGKAFDPAKMTRDEASAFAKALIDAGNMNAIAGLIRTLEPMVGAILAMASLQATPPQPATIPIERKIA